MQLIGLRQYSPKDSLQDPQQIEVSLKLTRQIGEEVSTNQSIIVITLYFCLALTSLFLIVPLLHRAAFRRRLRIFVSFSRLRNDVAEQLHVFLEKCRFRVSRVPFDENAEHQTTLQTIIALLRQSELVVCLPGPTYSFVEHEIMAANAIGHPVVFLVSRDDGTIPNTADKRYPMFQIETLAGNGFHPIETFLSFIGGDLRSMQNICAESLRQGRRLSLTIGLAILLFIVGLWISLFPSRSNGTNGNLGGPDQSVGGIHRNRHPRFFPGIVCFGGRTMLDLLRARAL